MALNIKNSEVEQLINEVAAITGETKTEVVRKALYERKSRLAFKTSNTSRNERILRLLQQEIWPQIPKDQLGRKLSKEEEEALLGFEEF